jgi:hypothetical protein
MYDVRKVIKYHHCFPSKITLRCSNGIFTPTRCRIQIQCIGVIFEKNKINFNEFQLIPLNERIFLLFFFYYIVIIYEVYKDVLQNRVQNEFKSNKPTT